MDYDKTAMPATYDAGRGYPPSVLAYWLDIISRSVEGTTIRRILDLGCGTGRYSEALAAHFDAELTAVDPSEQMLAAARAKATGRVEYKLARAEALPFASAAFDMVFLSMVLHHFADADAALGECHRVLRSGGVVCLRAGTREQIDDYAYQPFFPGTRKLLERTLHSQDEILSLFARAGFVASHRETVPSQAAASWPDYAQRLALKADSILVQLPDSEFATGLAALRQFAATQADDTPVIEPIDYFVFRRS